MSGESKPDNPIFDAPMKHDWLIDRSIGPSSSALSDCRNSAVADRLTQYFSDLRALQVEGDSLSELLRDAFQTGVSKHQLAAQLKLNIELVEHVIQGGSLFEIS